MSSQFTPDHLLRTVLIYVRWGLLLLLTTTTAYPQQPPVAFSLTNIPVEGVLLKADWQFQPGNNPNGASPQLDDRHWATIDPDKDIRELPQLRAGGIGWLRLHLTTGQNLPPVMAYIVQSVASEVYLDGQLLYRFGTFSTNPGRVQAYNPCAAFSLPLRSSSKHLLAVRFACQPGLDYNKKYLSWYPAVAQFRLFPASVLPALPADTLRGIYFDTLKIGISIILFILHLSLFFAYPSQRTNLYATGLYLLSSITFLARAANSFVHPMNVRIVVYYGSLIDIWVPAMVVLTLYSMFNFRKGWLCWLAIGSIGLKFVPLPADYQWVLTVVNFYLPLELIRLSLVASRNRLLGARIVTAGAFFNLGTWLTWSILSVLHVSINGHELLYDTLFVVSFLCFPLTLSLRLALEHGWVNRQLRTRLAEVEHLSARNLAQQQERQQLLATQNERLEQQVESRTAELKASQNQLIQKEKLASLGELTAGIAHEIQNPLNFVNNFSEVSVELVSELEEEQQKPRRDTELETELLGNLKANLRKINHHGGRASAIVKGMLEHSRTPTGERRPTDLNALADEYLRLSYQGLRAKDKDFNCDLVTNFTPDLSKVEVVSQDIGRVLLNLFNNAFYAVQQRQRQQPTGYQPTVTVNTRHSEGQFEIRVKDNGTGIPDAVKAKIFQPFFTTKPTGEGTGLGLSLSHDIMTKGHGGTLKAESYPGQGTEFTINLPIT